MNSAVITDNRPTGESAPIAHPGARRHGKEASVFRCSICALTAWAALGGTVHAELPQAEPVSERKRAPILATEATGTTVGTSHPKAVMAVPAGGAVQTSDAPPRKPGSEPLPPPTPVPGTEVFAEPVGPSVGIRPYDDRLAHPTGRFWSRLEFLLWATTGQSVSPAITASPPGTPINFAGIIPNPGTEVLFPRDRVNNEFRGGFRVTSGVWLDDTMTAGLEGDFFFIGNSKKGLTAASDSNGNQILARPYLNALTGAPAAIVAAFPGVSRGVLDVRAENSVIGGGVNLLYDIAGDPCNRFDLILGYRYVGVYDEVSIEQDSTALAPQPGVPFATRTQVLDRFNTENHFNGAVFGVGGERRFGVWFVGGRSTVAFGGVKQVVMTDGRTVITPATGLPQVTFQGLYAQKSNIGTRERTWFAYLPEVDLRLGVQFSESTRFYFGYTWMYLSSVVRAGEQIDVRVNPSFLPGGPAVVTGPQLPNLHKPLRNDYWMQGLNFGMEILF
jgi:Putative beta barrel porin-7 (BBP7)